MLRKSCQKNETPKRPTQISRGKNSVIISRSQKKAPKNISLNVEEDARSNTNIITEQAHTHKQPNDLSATKKSHKCKERCKPIMSSHAKKVMLKTFFVEHETLKQNTHLRNVV